MKTFEKTYFLQNSVSYDSNFTVTVLWNTLYSRP